MKLLFFLLWISAIIIFYLSVPEEVLPERARREGKGSAENFRDGHPLR